MRLHAESFLHTRVPHVRRVLLSSHDKYFKSPVEVELGSKQKAFNSTMSQPLPEKPCIIDD